MSEISGYTNKEHSFIYSLTHSVNLYGAVTAVSDIMLSLKQKEISVLKYFLGTTYVFSAVLSMVAIITEEYGEATITSIHSAFKIEL